MQIISGMNDHLYKNIIQKEENLKIIMKLFFELELKEIHYLNSELPRNQKELKGAINDL